jgi:hypothetical protein
MPSKWQFLHIFTQFHINFILIIPMIRIPAGTRDSSLLQTVQTGFGVHPASYSLGTGGLFSLGEGDVKWPGRQADHSPPSSAHVKNERSRTSTPPHSSIVGTGTTLPKISSFCSLSYDRSVASSFCNLSYDRSVASSKASSPQREI